MCKPAGPEASRYWRPGGLMHRQRVRVDLQTLKCRVLRTQKPRIMAGPWRSPGDAHAALILADADCEDEAQKQPGRSPMIEDHSMRAATDIKPSAAPPEGAAMSYPFSPDPQNKGLNPDESPGSQCRGSAVGAGAADPLGNLRNSRAAGGVGSLENASDCRKIPASEHDAKTVTQSERFDLQRASALLLPDMRVAHCLWTATGVHVDVIRRGGDARFEGVQTCGSWSSCPICSARIAETRRQELRALEEWAGSPRRGVRLVLMTLTARHRRRALGSLVKKMAAARNRMHGRKAYQRLRTAAIVGTVAVRGDARGGKRLAPSLPCSHGREG